MLREPPAVLPAGAHVLSLDDRFRFEERFAREPTCLAAYAFAPHVIWGTLLRYWWIELAGHLCLFAEDSAGCFMAVPPLGPSTGATQNQGDEGVATAWREAFALMRRRNGGSMVSRVENVPEELVPLVLDLGYVARRKEADYLYRRADLVALRGDRYRSQRAAYNRFLRTAGAIRYEVYRGQDRDDCLDLFQDWRNQRLSATETQGDEPASLARCLLEDAGLAHSTMLDLWDVLGLVGRVVRIDGRIRAYTFGYPRNREVFCVLAEIADRSIPGLSAYVFRELCREATGYTLVNTMDDSGLASLARSKRSYHPDRMIANYIVTEAG